MAASTARLIRNETMKSNTDSDDRESPLSHEQLAQIGEARMNAAQIAHREFVGLILMGVLTAMFALYGGISISSLIMGIWMIVGA